MPYKNPTENAACKREWYLRNRDVILEQGRDYRKKNKEKIATQKREYRRSHLAEKRVANQRWREANRAKTNESNRLWRLKQTLDERYHRHVRNHYGLTREEYNSLLAHQGGVCAICHAKPSTRVLDVDHDHITGEVRGLLCRRCNLGAGFVETLSTEDFAKMMEYLGFGDNAAIRISA